MDFLIYLITSRIVNERMTKFIDYATFYYLLILYNNGEAH